jgi:hypothetical protein
MDPETVFLWSEEAVGFVVRDIRPDLAHRWRGVVPKDVGINPDDWLEMSQRMVDRLNANAGFAISPPEPARKGFRTKRFISFALFLADKAI